MQQSFLNSAHWEYSWAHGLANTDPEPQAVEGSEDSVDAALGKGHVHTPRARV